MPGGAPCRTLGPGRVCSVRGLGSWVLPLLHTKAGPQERQQGSPWALGGVPSSSLSGWVLRGGSEWDLVHPVRPR